jgi:DNA-binding response OmpR family regulator
VTTKIVVGDLTLFPRERSAVADQHEIELRTKEFDLLLALASRPGVVLNRESLLREVWGRDYAVDSRTLDVHINRLRARLVDTQVEIETVRGVGYRLAAVRPPDS